MLKYEDIEFGPAEQTIEEDTDIVIKEEIIEIHDVNGEVSFENDHEENANLFNNYLSKIITPTDVVPENIFEEHEDDDNYEDIDTQHEIYMTVGMYIFRFDCLEIGGGGGVFIR